MNEGSRSSRVMYIKCAYRAAGLSGFAIVTTRDLHSTSHVRLMTFRSPPPPPISWPYRRYSVAYTLHSSYPLCLIPQLSRSYRYTRQRIPRTRIYHIRKRLLRGEGWYRASERRSFVGFGSSSYRLTVAEYCGKDQSGCLMKIARASCTSRSLIVGSINGVESLVVSSPCHFTGSPYPPTPHP